MKTAVRFYVRQGLLWDLAVIAAPCDAMLVRVPQTRVPRTRARDPSGAHAAPRRAQDLVQLGSGPRVQAVRRLRPRFQPGLAQHTFEPLPLGSELLPPR